jgi:hypothetical protein
VTGARTIDELLDVAWAEGPWRGDAARLRAAVASAGDHARRGELLAFATLAALVEGEPCAPLAPIDDAGGAPVVRVIASAARAWRAVRDGDARTAADAIAALEAALAEAGAEPRRAAAEALADLALAECALAAGQPLVARRRLRQAARRAIPSGTAVAVRLALTLRAMRGGQDDPAAGLAFLDEAAAIAERAARPLDQAAALTHAGVLAVIAGDPAGSRARLERAIALAPPGGSSVVTVARVLLASRAGGDRALEVLGDGLRAAAETGDYAAYVVLLVQGARVAADAGRLADAIAILDNGRAQLGALGPDAARPLDDEKARLRAEAGDERFADAQRKADALRARDAARG